MIDPGTGAAALGEAAVQPPGRDAGPRLADWLREGVRAAFFQRPAIDSAWQPTPAQLLAIVVVVTLLELGLGRLEIDGEARFFLRGWLLYWWSTGASLLLTWALLWRLPHDPTRPAGLATWVMLGFVTSLPILVFHWGVAIARSRELLPAVLETSAWVAWSVYGAFVAWGLGVAAFMGWLFGMPWWRRAILVAGTLGLEALVAWQFDYQAWYPVEPDPEDRRPRFSVSQEVFERQQAVWADTIGRMQAQRPGVVDVYGIVFAPYASEDVFLRESTMVSEVLAQRFDAAGRVLHLANHATSADRLPWATPLNLRRAVEAIAARMDKQEDVLVVYLTSHGGSDFKLAASHWPLDIRPLHAADLREALDEAGIRHRVVAVSACYSGGWVEALAGDTALVMTAADATHTSYGCGRKSQLTFFGRALFDEQLRTTRSFERAFAAAVPVIRQREIDARKTDGFSNPQISAGAAIRPVLDGLAQRLDAADAPAR